MQNVSCCLISSDHHQRQRKTCCVDTRTSISAPKTSCSTASWPFLPTCRFAKEMNRRRRRRRRRRRASVFVTESRRRKTDCCRSGSWRTPTSRTTWSSRSFRPFFRRRRRTDEEICRSVFLIRPARRRISAFCSTWGQCYKTFYGRKLRLFKIC
jgi:hypothetical protein